MCLFLYVCMSAVFSQASGLMCFSLQSLLSCMNLLGFVVRVPPNDCCCLGVCLCFVRVQQQIHNRSYLDNLCKAVSEGVKVGRSGGGW